MPLLSLIYTTSLCSLPSSKAEEHAKLRHIAADLLFVTGEVSGVPSLTIKSASFYHKTGVKWHELRKFDLTSSCFERATDRLSKIGIDTISDAGEKKLFLDLSIARSKTDWEVSNRNLVVALLNRATSLLFRSPEHYKTLVNQYSVFGKSREGTAGAETAKGVFLGQRCHVSASAAVRVSHRVLRESCSEGSKVRAKVVSELVSDDRVVTLFSGEAAAKQRTAMHDVLWNCAADHFRLKDYVTSADLFEKAMLYIPFDIENRILRAMGFYAFGG